MVCRHKFGDLCSEIHDENQQHEYGYHECLTIFTSPFSKYGMICFEIFGLKYSESPDDEYENNSEYT